MIPSGLDNLKTLSEAAFASMVKTARGLEQNGNQVPPQRPVQYDRRARRASLIVRVHRLSPRNCLRALRTRTVVILVEH